MAARYRGRKRPRANLIGAKYEMSYREQMNQDFVSDKWKELREKVQVWPDTFGSVPCIIINQTIRLPLDGRMPSAVLEEWINHDQ